MHACSYLHPNWLLNDNFFNKNIQIPQNVIVSNHCVKVACVQSLVIAGDIMQNDADFYVLCFSRPAKFKLIILRCHMSQR